MVPRRRRELTGKQKAAVLLISLGPEIAARVYQHLSEDEIEQLTYEISNLQKVDTDQEQQVLKEFHDIAVAKDYILTGGIEYAQEVLERALGREQAERVFQKLTSSLQVRPFHQIRRADPQQLATFLQDEHPQTMALVLSYLDADQAALVLSALPPALQADVARRIALMNSTSPDVVAEVEQVLENKLAMMTNVDTQHTGGVDTVVKILNNVDRGTEKSILETLGQEDPELVDNIKQRMFTFDDIVLLDARSIQRIIRDVDPKDLQLALKVAGEQVQEVIFRNMSKRMAESFREDMEYMGPVRLRDVEDAQQRIVGLIRRLEEAGEIIVTRAGGDDVIV
ncbi:flagellar motor switch protein FliG [Alicyclobacillus herbarius]|uniref:flagellar motor switch protein FliG n=1 Tax=Alicyclobacillus herbarius TaxID=122960 RepID=UPI000424C045|nr:flagellar motor switch protein FliG [Alicyclobacillus herbarius]